MAKRNPSGQESHERYLNRKSKPKPRALSGNAERGLEEHPTWLALLDIYPSLELIYELRSGKEAAVYAVEDQEGLWALKLYQDARIRTFQNDDLYQEGRTFTDQRAQKLKEEGRKLKVPPKQMRWIASEYDHLEKLFSNGVSLPKPRIHVGQAILMEWIGDASGAAPRLADLSPFEGAEGAFDQSLDQLTRMLQLGYVHGDYSAFNLLWWNERVYAIDFPQSVEIAKNPHWKMLLERDVQTLCMSFTRLGVRRDPKTILERIFQTLDAQA